jgi:putative membrane protein insertion efficiency factor
MLAGLACALISLYQKTLSPDHGWLRLFYLPFLGQRGACRFQPTCSEYAKEAITRHGLVRGTMLAFSRVARCHPWSKGGYNPAPEDSKFQVPKSKQIPNSNDQTDLFVYP